MCPLVCSNCLSAPCTPAYQMAESSDLCDWAVLLIVCPVPVQASGTLHYCAKHDHRILATEDDCFPIFGRKVSRNQSWPIPSFLYPESLTENLAPKSDEFDSRHISVSKPCNFVVVLSGIIKCSGIKLPAALPHAITVIVSREIPDFSCTTLLTCWLVP